MTEQKLIKIANTEIHIAAELFPTEFLKRVKNVKMIRTGVTTLFTFYPTDKEQVAQNRRTWEFVNGNLNVFNEQDRHYVFYCEFPAWLYLFLRYSTWDNVQKSIIVALTGLYACNPPGREHMNRQLEPELLTLVKDQFHANFNEFESFVFIQTEDWDLMGEINTDYWKKYDSFLKKFDYYFRDNSGNPILIPHVYPLADTRFKQPSSFQTDKFDVDCSHSYFTESDWNNVLQKDSNDALNRAESEEEPWREWRIKFIEKNRIDG